MLQLNHELHYSLFKEYRKVRFIGKLQKDVDNLAKIGLIATTNSGGAGKWNYLNDYSALYNHKIVVIPDKDELGYRHGEDICKYLSGKVNELRYIVLGGEGKDTTDWLNAGGTKEELLNLAQTALIWKPEIKI